MAGGPVLLITLTALSTAAVIVSLVFGILGDLIPNNGIFNTTIAEMFSKYPSDMNTIGGWYQGVLTILVYLFQAAWLVYTYTTMCRTNSDGLVMLNPVVLPVKFHLAYILSCGLSVFGLDAFLREQFLLSALVEAGMSLTGFLAMFINIGATYRNQKILASKSPSDLICIRVLIQNGLNLFFSWTTYMTLVNVSMAMTYDPNVAQQYSQEDAGTFCLYALGILILGWSILENTKLFTFGKYLYGWYLVLVWVLTGMIIRDPDVGKKNTIISIILLCLSVVCFAAKITVFMLAPQTSYKKAKKYQLIDEEWN